MTINGFEFIRLFSCYGVYLIRVNRPKARWTVPLSRGSIPPDAAICRETVPQKYIDPLYLKGLNQ